MAKREATVEELVGLLDSVGYQGCRNEAGGSSRV